MGYLNLSIKRKYPMGVYLSMGLLENPDTLLTRLQQEDKAIIVNDLDDSEESSDIILANNRITVGASISSFPICSCKRTVSHGPLGFGDQVVCKYCLTSPTTDPIGKTDPSLFIRAPDNTLGFLSPMFFTQLHEVFYIKPTKFSPILYLTDLTYKERHPDIEKLLSDNGIQRGYNHTITNLTHILDVLTSADKFSDRKNIRDIYTLWNNRSQHILTKHLFLPARSLFVVEENGDNKYCNTNFKHIADIVTRVRGLSFKKPLTEHQAGTYTSKIQQTLHEFYKEYIKKIYAEKKGAFRSHIFSLKPPTTTRAVVTSIGGPCKYDEIIFPWVATLVMLKTYIVSKLLELHPTLTLTEAVILVEDNAYTTEPRIQEAIDIILTNMPSEAIPIILQRFPSLHIWNLLRFKAKVNPNPVIRSIQFPLITVRSLNLDYDGDEENITLVNKNLHDSLKFLSPHYAYLDKLQPLTISNHLYLGSCLVGTIANWKRIADVHRTPSKQEVTTMENLFT